MSNNRPLSAEQQERLIAESGRELEVDEYGKVAPAGPIRDIAAALAAIDSQTSELASLRQSMAGVQGALADACDVLAIREDGDYGQSVRQVVAERNRLRGLLRRIHDWDHMDSAGDGAYWRREIVAALAEKGTT